MLVAQLATPDDFDGWRDQARAMAAADVPPDEIDWRVAGSEGDLFSAAERNPAPPTGTPFSVPRAFVALAQDVLLHSDAERFALLYTFLLRLKQHTANMEDRADATLRRLEHFAREVRRDIHKMRAFLRFREVAEGEDVRFVAWFEPSHHIVRRNATFFLNRFASMKWTILTPELSLNWDGETLTEGPGAVRADAPEGDPLEETWKTYYASIFNPARVKIGAMLKEMPKKYWKNMPETALVPSLIAGARTRELEMIDKSRREVGGNILAAWEALRAEAAACTRCHLYKHATQTVFGEGAVEAPLMFVGEQPGDQEDLAGHPFVGPAGQMFNRALEEAGIDRATTYVTNAVKHFKYEQRGQRRIHSKPEGAEIEACKWWIEQEREILRPRLTVALGATAARSLLGRVVTISGSRGIQHRLADGGEAMVTVHPSFLLRIPERDRADMEYRRFVEDLKRAGRRLAELAD